jgi:AraC family transcriptional regulator
MSLTAKAIWIIERNFGDELSLTDIADACGVSRFHLARAFEARIGMTVMQYLRARRLSEAARALANGATDILSVALDAGYGSHEAFTRAFRAQFDLTPDAVRKQQTTQGLTMIDPAKLSDDSPASDAPAPRIETRSTFTVAGLAQQQSLAGTAAIPGQWQNFMMNYYESVPHKAANSIPLSVITEMDGDGHFQYLCGVEVAKATDLPRGLIAQTIPAQTYVVFTHNGHVSAIGKTYEAIWDRWLPESKQVVCEGPWLERHLPTFNPRTGLGGIEIWIPVVAG